MTPEEKEQHINSATQAVNEDIAAGNQAQAERAKTNPVAAPLGRIAGQSAPFLAPQLGIGGALARGAAPVISRVAAQSALGAAEGGIIASGQGGDKENIITNMLIGAGVAGSLEAAAPFVKPVIQKVSDKAKALWQKSMGKTPIPKEGLITPDGQPTAALQEELKRSGQSFEDLTREAITELKAANPDIVAGDALRTAQAKSVSPELRTTKGDVTQEYGQKRREAELQQTINAEGKGVGERIRNVRETQAGVLQDKLTQMVDDLGLPADANTSIKEALEGRAGDLSSKKNELYQEVGKLSKTSAPIPIFTDSIAAALPDKATLRRISRAKPSEVGAVDDLLVEFGISKDKEAAKRFIDSGGEITPLTINNLEDFRSALNLIGREAKSDAVDVIINPIRKALDSEADLAVEALEKAGVPSEILSKLKEARSTVREIKTEFSPDALSGKLIGSKQDGVTPLVQTQDVYNQLLKPGRRTGTEGQLKQVIDNLEKSGEKGQKAIQNLQSKVAFELLNEGFRGASNRTGGKQLFNAGAYNRLLEGYGESELKLIFKDNPEALKKLKEVGQVGKMITPSSFESLKGSSNTLVDIFGAPFRTIPGLKHAGDLFRLIKDKRALKNALKNNPRLKKEYDMLTEQFPGILEALSVAKFNKEPPNKEEK